MKKDDWNIKGQMDIFDFLKPEKDEVAAEPETICSMAAECEAYKNGCNGTIEPCSFGGPYKWNAMKEPQPREVVVKGFMDYGYCPNCEGCQDDLVKECKYCGQLLSWEHWKVINDYTEEAND